MRAAAEKHIGTPIGSRRFGKVLDEIIRPRDAGTKNAAIQWMRRFRASFGDRA
jgi:hypothetical protein